MRSAPAAVHASTKRVAGGYVHLAQMISHMCPELGLKLEDGCAAIALRLPVLMWRAIFGSACGTCTAATDVQLVHRMHCQARSLLAAAQAIA